MLFNLIMASLVASCTGFSKIPMVSYIHNFDSNLENVKIFEPLETNKENTPCILFFTGGSSLVIPEIYNNFFNNIVQNNISICTPSILFNDFDKLIYHLDNEYSEVILAGHSSGITTALNNNNNKIKKIISLDGVDTSIFRLKKNKKFNCKNIDSALFLNAGKSYKFTYNPPGVAFIPFLSLKKENLDVKTNIKYIELEANNYGHCDILDSKYSNIMHATRISVGFSDRSLSKLDRYHKWLSDVINNFICKKYDNIKKLSDEINYEEN